MRYSEKRSRIFNSMEFAKLLFCELLQNDGHFYFERENKSSENI